MFIDNNYRIFLCGDVMTGRGMDQILPHPNQPTIYESVVSDARDYVQLAEMAHGRIQGRVNPDYIWGDAMVEWQKHMPQLKIINLETAITACETYWLGKGINYRMHPDNVDVLTAAKIDVCTLANNHSLDWDIEGLYETLRTLQNVGIRTAGAGENRAQAMAPVIIPTSPTSRILIFALGAATSGIPESWEATNDRGGVFYLPDLGDTTAHSITDHIKHYYQPGDLCIVSIHWGSNWGYSVPESQRLFAHYLIDHAPVDVIFGHSSHHPRPIELYRGKPVLYGCGDFINDYEGISGHEEFRGDLSVMYFLTFDNHLKLAQLELVILHMHLFQLHYASEADTQWLLQTLNRESASFSTTFNLHNAHTLRVRL